MIIRSASKSEFAAIVKMARTLWPDARPSELKKELSSKKFTYYVAEDNKELAGFIALAVRRDYVEGSTTSPVGYVEGLYVDKKCRKKGVGRELVNAAEKWCLKNGLHELGSDVEFQNKVSQKFHSSVGFKKGDMIVPYIKKVRPR